MNVALLLIGGVLHCVPKGAICDHKAMTECCDGCGHFSCPCGVNWDEGAEGPGPFDEDYYPDGIEYWADEPEGRR